MHSVELSLILECCAVCTLNFVQFSVREIYFFGTTREEYVSVVARSHVRRTFAVGCRRLFSAANT